MAETKKYEPFIFLSTRVTSAAVDMIEEIGFLTGVRHTSVQHIHEPHQMLGLRRAIAKAQAALASYDVVMGAGLENLTSEEFEAAAKHICDERAVSQ
jgi:hypothetical protein